MNELKKTVVADNPFISGYHAAYQTTINGVKLFFVLTVNYGCVAN